MAMEHAMVWDNVLAIQDLIRLLTAVPVQQIITITQAAVVCV